VETKIRGRCPDVMLICTVMRNDVASILKIVGEFIECVIRGKILLGG
jgi:hypothetical protein